MSGAGGKRAKSCVPSPDAISPGASRRRAGSARFMTPLPRVSDVCGKDGFKRYARTGANEGANAFAIAAFARLSKFALVRRPLIHEVTDNLGLHAVKRTPIDAWHPPEK